MDGERFIQIRFLYARPINGHLLLGVGEFFESHPRAILAGGGCLERNERCIADIMTTNAHFCYVDAGV